MRVLAAASNIGNERLAVRQGSFDGQVAVMVSAHSWLAAWQVVQN